MFPIRPVRNPGWHMLTWGSALLKYLQAASCMEKQSIWYITDLQHSGGVLHTRRDQGFRERCVHFKQTLLVIRLDLGSDFGGHQPHQSIDFVPQISCL